MISKAFDKSIELINLTVTVYMIVQGLGLYWLTLPLSASHLMSNTLLPFSPYVLGNFIRPLGEKTYVHQLHGHTVAILRWTCACTHKRLLRSHAPPMLTGLWLCKHDRVRCVFIRPKSENCQ